MNVILKTEKLRVEFKSREFRQQPKVALRGLDLEVNAGEVFGFLGPNGAGKTTTINVLLGFVQPTSGSASLFGIDVRQPIARQRIGYLPEMTYYYKFLTAEELLRVLRPNLRLAARAKRNSALTTCLNSSNWNTPANASSKPIPKECSSASALRRRSSTIPICSFSTNRPAASTRWAA